VSDTTSAPARSKARDLRPPELRKHQLVAVLVASAAIALGASLIQGPVGLGLLANWLTLSMVGVGFYLVFGLGGQFAFSQAAFYGLGAYTSAWVTRQHVAADGVSLVGGRPFLVGLLAAIVISAVVALAFSVLVQRADHFYFAIATLALSYIGTVFFQQSRGFSNGGDVSRVVPASIGGFRFDTPHRHVALLVGGLAIFLVAVALIERSPLRRESIALRDNALATSTTGVPVKRLRFALFVLGSTMAAAAGSLYAHTNGSLSLDTFGLTLGINIFLVVLFGGIGTMWGALLGAAFVVWVPSKLEIVGQHEDLVYGLTLIVVMVLFPRGLAGIVGDLRDRFWPGAATAEEGPDG
jgi:branched-chain amino acid transport system permease protein